MIITQSAAPARPGLKERLSALRQTLPWILRLLWQSRPRLLVTIVCLTLLQAGAPALQVALSRHLIDAIAAALGPGGAPVRPALFLLGLQVGLSLILTLLGGWNQITTTRLLQAMRYTVEGLISQKATALPLAFFDQPEAMDQLQRARQDQSQGGTNLIQGLLNSVQSVLTLVTYVAILATFHWSLGLLMALYFLLNLWTNTRAGSNRFRLMRSLTQSYRRAGYLVALMTGREAAAEIRLFGLAERLRTRWRELTTRLERESLALETKANVTRMGMDGLGSILTAVISGSLILLAVGGHFTLGTYVAVTQALASVQATLNGLAGNLARVYENALFATDLREFLTLQPEPVAEGRPFPSPLREGIRVEDLTFQYAGRPAPTLKGISVTIPAGATVAIVGENGAGKSTFVKCLLGLYQPSSGTIRFDGIPVQELEPTDLRQKASAAFQDFVSYQMTLRENIALGQADLATDEDAILDAAAKGGASEVAATLPQGMETELGISWTGGKQLSGGQWQKVALSRAFVRDDAEVVVLDEPTAALDPRAEAALFERFATLMEGKTAFMISHRLASCRMADLILVLQDGQLVEQGSHEALVARGGLYADLFATQAQWYIS